MTAGEHKFIACHFKCFNIYTRPRKLHFLKRGYTIYNICPYSTKGMTRTLQRKSIVDYKQNNLIFVKSHKKQMQDGKKTENHSVRRYKWLERQNFSRKPSQDYKDKRNIFTMFDQTMSGKLAQFFQTVSLIPAIHSSVHNYISTLCIC